MLSPVFLQLISSPGKVQLTKFMTAQSRTWDPRPFYLHSQVSRDCSPLLPSTQGKRNLDICPFTFLNPHKLDTAICQTNFIKTIIYVHVHSHQCPLLLGHPSSPVLNLHIAQRILLSPHLLPLSNRWNLKLFSNSISKILYVLNLSSEHFCFQFLDTWISLSALFLLQPFYVVVIFFPTAL